MNLKCYIAFMLAFMDATSARRRRSQQCREDKLELKEDSDNVVFTGTVEKVYRAQSDVYRGVVRVKRVLRGDHTLTDNTVIIEGFGDPHICHSDVRERDTRIFLVNQLDNGHLRLNSSVIRVNVVNLDKAAAAVRGLPLKERRPAAESLCEKMYCAYGAQCVVDQRIQRAYCRCQETCSDIFAPVCGSNGVTYSSDCQLRMASCTTQKRIFTKRQGPCDLNDPCLEKECFFGAQCNPFLDGRTAECICPEKCATYGGNRAFRPVCGTDGRDYPNVCEMRRASCLEMREIEVRYKGKCDPCEDITCFAYQVCQLDENRQPHCRCNDVCTPDYRPVCGSDGQTYTNECILRVESCKRQKNIRVIYSGECNAGSNPCDLIKCGPSQECDVDRHGVASCQCPTPCEPTMQPLCGSNGRTFDNECELKRQSCLLRQELTQIHQGECGEFGPCHSHRCSYGAICVVKSGQPVCDCPTCAEEFEPICGTDGISYTNICKMRKEACEQKTEILVQRIGLCNVCDSQKCDFYAVCESDSKGGTTCVCPRVCVKIEAAICGTDGVTYQNECELRVEACKQQKYIAVATRGPCERCHQIVCKHGARCDNGKCVCPFNCPETFQQVCASDNKTYRNACEMKRIGCQKSVELNILFYGKCGEALIPEEDATVKKHFIGNITSCQDMECKFGGICNFNAEGTPHCVCNFHCSLVREPVCGLDGKVYDNSCKLREESCKQQKRITPVAREVCSAQLDIPCEGNPPLIDASTQKQYFCGKGPGATLCPPKSYCHETEHFSTCCKETPLVKNCRDTPFGCCPDRKTPVSGPNNGGCPSVCNCDPLGAFSSTCDPVTKQCPCKPGVGGLRCDRCEPGFWGLHMISDGNSGCSNCNCNPYGSIRDDCDQMTGRCVCKHGIHSMKCDKCPSGTILGAEGCMDVSTTKTVVRSCEDLECYHGAVCLEENRRARCSCDFQCSPEGSKDPACGTDGNTYGSECQMKLFSCRYQKPISVRFYGHCNRREDFEIPTVQPTRKPPRRRIHMKRLDNKATREVTAGLPENLFLTTSAPAPITATPPVPQFMALSPDLTTQVEIPAFSGNSYLVLYKLDAYTRLSLEIEFKTYTHEGIILYNGQTSSGPGDFVSLAIRESFLEFRYNLGSGPVILKSAQKIHQGEYYTVTAKRYLRDGMLSIQGQESVSGKSQGTLNSLDLTENLFVGMIPEASKVTIANVGIESGFKGCIRRLKIDRREVNLRYPSSREIMRGHDISECQGGTCSNMPCQNGGTCITQEEKFKCLCFHNYTGSQCESNIHLCNGNPCGHGSTCDVTPQGEFKCKCPPGKSGRLCDKLHKGVDKVFIPDFSNHSYLELTMMQNVRQAFSIEVWFLARDPNGVLLYNGQLVNGKGDFISLNLLDGFLQFRYNLGSGIAKIMSTFPIEMNTWNSVKISRLRRQGTLKMNNQTAVIGKSKAPLTELNLGQPLYIGGFPSTQILHHESGVATSFDGAIQRIALNGEIWDQLTTRAIQSHGVRRYKGPPCVSGSCLHGGMCIPELNDFRCRCTPKYTGRNCEKRIRKRNRRKALHFNGTTQLSFLFKSPRGLKRRKSNRIQIRFRASSPNGLLFWTSKGISSNGDYLAIALVDGYAEMGYNLGKTKGHYSIRSNSRVDDEYWHTLTVLRKKKLVEIRIDKRQPVSNASETGLIDHNTNGLLWIGGSPKLPVGLPLDYYTKFEGCIDSITVDGFPLRLISTHTSKIEYCEHSKIR